VSVPVTAYRKPRRLRPHLSEDLEIRTKA
jgi:hypothetical protein